MHGKLHSVGNELKKVNRRIDTLTEHLRQSDNYKEHRNLNAQYERIYSEYTKIRKEKKFRWESRSRKALEAANAFFEDNRAGLTLFKAADKYLRGVMQDRFDPKKLPPITMWEKELAEKKADESKLYQEYVKLRDETSKVEKIQRSVKEILHSETRERTRQKSRGMAL